MHLSKFTGLVAALVFVSTVAAIPAATTTKVATTTARTTTKSSTTTLKTTTKVATTTSKPSTTTISIKSTTKSTTTTSSSTTGVPQPTCKTTVANFDEFPNAGGRMQTLPGGGYDYLGLTYEPGQFGYVSKGLSYNGDFTEDDRKVNDANLGQLQDIVVHSGSNALMPSADGFTRSFYAARYKDGVRYFNPQSMWIAPENAGKPFNFRVDCSSWDSKEDKSQVFAIPSVPAGQMYQLVFPADWRRMWQCTLGPTDLQQFVLDDFQYCLWEIPYGTYPW